MDSSRLYLLDHLFLRVRTSPFFYRFTLFTRLLLSAGFLPTGLIKLMNRRFTIMGTETPIGAFFEAMYQTGLFWQFIGLAQVVAAILLLFPRSAHLGAALFFPVILNIFVITVALDFRGTPMVTGAMFLAVSWLVFYDWHRFRPLIHEHQPKELEAPMKQSLDSWERLGFAVFGICLMLFFFGTRYPRIPGFWFLPLLATMGGLLALGRFVFINLEQRKTSA